MICRLVMMISDRPWTVTNDDQIATYRLCRVRMRAHCTGGLELSRQQSRSGVKITFWDSLPKFTYYQSICYFSSEIMLTV